MQRHITKGIKQPAGSLDMILNPSIKSHLLNIGILNMDIGQFWYREVQLPALPSLWALRYSSVFLPWRPSCGSPLKRCTEVMKNTKGWLPCVLCTLTPGWWYLPKDRLFSTAYQPPRREAVKRKHCHPVQPWKKCQVKLSAFSADCLHSFEGFKRTLPPTDLQFPPTCWSGPLLMWRTTGTPGSESGRWWGSPIGCPGTPPRCSWKRLSQSQRTAGRKILFRFHRWKDTHTEKGTWRQG